MAVIDHGGIVVMVLLDACTHKRQNLCTYLLEAQSRVQTRQKALEPCSIHVDHVHWHAQCRNTAVVGCSNGTCTMTQPDGAGCSWMALRVRRMHQRARDAHSIEIDTDDCMSWVYAWTIQVLHFVQNQLEMAPGMSEHTQQSQNCKKNLLGPRYHIWMWQMAWRATWKY